MVLWDLTTCGLVDRHSFSLKTEKLNSSKMVVPTYHSTSCQTAVDSNLDSSLTLMWEVCLLLFECIPRSLIHTEYPCFNLGPFAEQIYEG